MAQPTNTGAMANQHHDLHISDYNAGWKRYYCDPNGSDTYDGKSKRFPKATIAAVMTLSGTQGDVYFGPASFPHVDTITKPMSVRMHGTNANSSAGLGTEFVATGFPDDGRPGLITATNATADDTRAVIENIRFTGPGNMTGGGNCINLRNVQNASVYRDIQIGGWNSGSGVYAYDTYTASSVNYPGYILLQRVWVTGGVYGFTQESGTTGVRYEMCAGDHTSATLASFRILKKPNGAAFAVSACTQSGSTVTMTATGITAAAGNSISISGVTPSGYNGSYRVASAPDANTITYLCDTTGLGAGSAFGTAQKQHSGNRGETVFDTCKQEGTDNDVPVWLVESTQRVTLINCAGNKVTGAGSAPLVQWNGPLIDELNVALMVPPLSSIGTTNKNRPYHIIAPRFGGDNVDYTIGAQSSGGGRGVLFNFPETSLYGRATWDPGNIASDAGIVSTTVTVTGANIGDLVTASLSTITTQDVLISAHVQATNTVRVVVMNKTGGALDLGSGQLRVKVLRGQF